MRGFGDYHPALVAEHGDPRLLELFGHLRNALDTFERIMLRPHVSIAEAKPQPQATPERPAAGPELAVGNPNKMAYTVKEVRNLVGISAGTFYELLKRGELKAVKLGKRTLVPAKELHEWLEKLPPQSRRSTPMPSGTR
jgi:excisionase family DNA binding protein